MNEIEIPPSVRKMMAEIGPKWATQTAVHVKMMIDAFTPILVDAPKAGVTRTDDLAYGTDPRQNLDLFVPSVQGGDKKRPMLLFIHGGAFVDGEKNRSAEIYSNVCWYFARHGIVAANVEYRQAPATTYPGCIEDMRLAVAWARANAAKYGADPNRVFLMGHSAGAAHAAGYAYERARHPADGAGLAGLIVVSGRVRADNRADNPNAKKVEAYYGTSDAARLDALSPVGMVETHSVPTFIAYGQYENPRLDIYCLELAHRLAQAKGAVPPLMVLPGHNHTSIIAHFNTAEESLPRALVEFMTNTQAERK